MSSVIFKIKRTFYGKEKDKLKEILGAELDNTFAELGIEASKTYEIKNKPWKYCENYQVWELSDEDYEKLCAISDADWKDDWGWWRLAEGSNLGCVYVRYNINNHYIKAWDGVSRLDFYEENKSLKPEDRYWAERKYSTLLEYFCDEIGVSTEKNVCAVATDLAKQNNMTMAELFVKFQG